MLDQSLKNIVQTHLQGAEITSVDVIQGLWGGYGELLRVYLNGSDENSVMIKRIQLPKPSTHPHGWNTNLSHERKLKSYRVEMAWYQRYSNTCHKDNVTPLCLGAELTDNEITLVMQNLCEHGFPLTLSKANHGAIHSCLKWLGFFHGQFMNESAEELWEIGTYWHLATRPDELAALSDPVLKLNAKKLDQILANSPYQTLVHGDAKLANFCFSDDFQFAAAVDFQYVGKGCGMKDVTLFLSSVLSFEESEATIEGYLNIYFDALKRSLSHHHPDIDSSQVEANWRPLYAIAWADFQRFIKGWKPSHWKINPYTESLTNRAIQLINNPKSQLGE